MSLAFKLQPRLAARLISRQAARPATMVRPVGFAGMHQQRLYSSAEPQQDPKAKAHSIIEALPGNNAVSKTGFLATSTAAAVYFISGGFLVVDAELVMAGSFAVVVYILGKFGGPAWTELANGHVKSIKDVLTSARKGHVEAVQDRITSVNQLKDVVETTKTLFAVSKETAQLEAQAFERKQQVDFANEAKSVLDSWVRYEGQLRQREQEELASTVISKINKEVGTAKFKQQVLEQAVADVEKVFAKA